MYECKILADSLSPEQHRLTTFEVTFPRFILAEVNTHRMLSRNSASSRAIPIHKSIAAVEEDPFIPQMFGKNKPGMSFDEAVETKDALETWLAAEAAARLAAQKFVEHEVHKSLGNRVLEPFKWHTAILSGTDWGNYFALRTDKNAQPEFRQIAQMMQETYQESVPEQLDYIQWHLPLVNDDEIEEEALQWPEPFVDWQMWRLISIGRCARVSYLTHDGKRDLVADRDLARRLLTNGHLSPFEHVARPLSRVEWALIHKVQRVLSAHSWPIAKRLMTQIEYCGNFRGWHQARYDVPHQSDFSQLQDAVD